MQQFGVVTNADQHPEAVALVADDEQVTYHDLEQRCLATAGALAERGVGAGDRVAVLVGNSIEWFVVVHATGHLGAVAVPVNTHFKANEVAHVVRDSGSDVVVTDELRAPALAAVDGVERLIIGGSYDRAVASATPLSPEDVVADGWPTTMLYTSGTTGSPKGVAIGADDFRRRAAGVALMAAPWSIGAEDAYLLVGPAYHGGPAIWAQVHLAVGGRVVVMGTWNAARFVELVHRHRITVTHLVPTNFFRLLELDDENRPPDAFASLRVVLHAAAPCPVSVKHRIMDLFPPDTVWEYYGASEGGGTSIGPQEWLAKPGSVGRPYPGNEFQIRGEAGLVQPPGVPGRIWVRTAHSSFEYHEDPDRTAATYDDEGWFSVGDVGYLDEDGYLFLTDRVADMVISGGVNIYPREIEDRLYSHPDVVDCAVFGIPDDQWGEALVAVIEARTGTELDHAAVRAWVAEGLADYKRPRYTEFVAELPRDPNGKVRKHLLRSDYLARLRVAGS